MTENLSRNEMVRWIMAFSKNFEKYGSIEIGLQFMIVSLESVNEPLWLEGLEKFRI